jgi:endonuclease/exonuclease/phosphatase family metal-dependent hydrolase
VRLVTVNLYNGRAVPRDLARLLEQVRPDVVCAQEVGPDSARVLRRFLPYGLAEPSLDPSGRALVAGFPLSVEPLDLPWRSGYQTAVDVDGALVRILSVHLANPIDRRSSVPARRRQLDVLDEHLEGTDPLVLVGDLNSTPAWPAYRRLRRHLDDAIADWSSAAGTRPAATWSKYPRWPAVLRIDHVLTRRVRVTACSVERIAGVDHRAVIVDLAIS